MNIETTGKSVASERDDRRRAGFVGLARGASRLGSGRRVGTAGHLDASPPTLAVVLKPDHVRDVDLFVRRYGVKASSCDPLPLQEPAGSLEKARTIGHDQAPQRHAVRMPARISDGMAASRKMFSRPLREMEAIA